jgi:hypothetical protein
MSGKRTAMKGEVSGPASECSSGWTHGGALGFLLMVWFLPVPKWDLQRHIAAHKSHDTQDRYMRHPRRSLLGLQSLIALHSASCDCGDLRPRRPRTILTGEKLATASQKRGRGGGAVLRVDHRAGSSIVKGGSAMASCWPLHGRSGCSSQTRSIVSEERVTTLLGEAVVVSISCRPG